MKGKITLFIALVSIFFCSARKSLISDTYRAQITDIPIGKYILDQSIQLGFQTMNQDGSSINAAALFDGNADTSLKFDSLKQLRLLLAKDPGKMPYPCSNLYIMNGKNGSEANRIKTIQIEIEAKGQRIKWTFELHDTLQYQRLDFPKPVWLRKKSEIRIRPLELYSGSTFGEISELAIEFE